MTGISGVRFETAWRNRMVARLDGVRVPVLGVRELRRNKRAAGRPKDLADLALLDEVTTPGRRPAGARRARARRPAE